MIRHLTPQDLVAAQAGTRSLAQLISLIENPYSTPPYLLTRVEAHMLNRRVAERRRERFFPIFQEGFRIQYNWSPPGTLNTVISVTIPGTFKWNTSSNRWETLIPGQGTHYIKPHPSGVGGYTVQNTTTPSFYRGAMFYFRNTVFI